MSQRKDPIFLLNEREREDLLKLYPSLAPNVQTYQYPTEKDELLKRLNARVTGEFPGDQ